MEGEVDNYDMEDDYDNALEKPSLSGLNPSPSRNMPIDNDPEEEDDDDDDDEEDDDEDDEEEEEEEGDEARPRKKKRSRKRNAINRFIDTEAVVDDDDEDFDDDEEELTKESRDFIAVGDDDVDPGEGHLAAGHRSFSRRDHEEDEQDLARVAQEVKERYSRTAVRYSGDSSDVPQRLLMPGVSDASLWQVRVRPGKERELVFQLMRKSLDLHLTNRPLEILSAFERDSLPGMIYVEAHGQQAVKNALEGLVGVFPSRGIALVPVNEMASLLRIKKQVTTITPGSWVRIKRGKYGGDLAQVLDVTDNGEEAGLKFIPRIDLTPKEDVLGDRKRKKSGATPQNIPGFKPPQRFFNAEEVSKVFKNKVNLKPGHSRKFVFMGDTYNNGFIEKDIRISGLITENVNPTLDEIARFTAGDQEADGAENAVDLSIIAADARRAATAVLQPGDHVEVFEGEQTGMHGIVESIQGEVVALRAKHVDIEGQRIEVPANSVRKKFKAGDHVKVMAGKNTDETGLVVSVLNDVVTFLSDMTMQEVTVFSKDVREAAETGAGTNTVGAYELHDLVQLDQQTVGVVYKTERDTFRVIDQNGHTRLVQPHQITMRRDSRRAIATDSQGYEIRISDNMKETDGEGRKGTVLHIHQSFYAFLHNRDIIENGGVFVTRARGLMSVAPKGRSAGPDLSKLNPAIAVPAGGMVGSGNMGKGRKDQLIGVSVQVCQGQFKSYVGIIKDINGQTARVELQTQNKVITIDKTKLKRKAPDGKLTPLEGFGAFNLNGEGKGSGNGGFGGGGQNGMMPPPNMPSRTPNPYTSGRTPNPYGDGGRTPFGGDGGRTPGSNAWAAASRTPNPYASSRTPNPYNSSGGDVGGRTPFGGFGGGRTPARGVGGGATPNPYASRSDPRTRPGAATPAGAGASSTPSGWGSTPTATAPATGANDGWGSAAVSDGWESAAGTGADGWGAAASTPAAAVSAPTPGVFASSDDWGAAPTPYTGAPTPYASAPTPGVGGSTSHHHAVGSTPGVYGNAQTPGLLGAPTPGFSAPTPAAGASGLGGWGDHGMGGLSMNDTRDSWLVGLKNVCVRIESDESGDSFHDGEFDDEEVVALSVEDMSASESGLASTANCRFSKEGINRAVPVSFLVHVEPKEGDLAVVLTPQGGGFDRGKIVKVVGVQKEVVHVIDDTGASGGGVANDAWIDKEKLSKCVRRS
ncbi:transcription elongation factor spt5 [Tulasnella sp. 331]|nr:transcription elongation factor spt5 [Tulasnella sp. 331]